MIGFSRPLLACVFLATQLGTGEATQCFEQDTPPQLSDDDLKTVVITKAKNSDILDVDAFSLTKTLDNIIMTARGAALEPTAADREAFLETLLEGLRAKTLSNDAAGITFRLDPDDRVLTAKELLDAQGPHGMQPVGLFNRIDLAPKSLLNCGEYRIVYAKTKSGAGNLQRFFLNFEAVLPNPYGSDTVGCQQVAALWRSLKSLPAPQAKQTLLKFYYSGGPIAPGGLSFTPVIDFQNFGSLGPGQVRSNRAVQTVLPWQLREWKIMSGPAKAPTFTAAPVNTTPVPAYFGGRDADVIPGDADKIAALRESFQKEFLGANVGQLTSIDVQAAKAPVSAQELIAGVGVQLETKFDAVQSKSGPGILVSEDSPTERARDSGFSAQVATQIRTLNLDCGLTADHVLNRMGAMSCGGCHHFSNNREIAPGIRWPSSLSDRPDQPDRHDRAFVHIDEKGNLSELLLKRFLPARAEITSKAASGNFPYAQPIAPADVLQKLAFLRELLETTQKPNAPPRFSEIEALSIDLRRSFAQEPGAFVMFRKPD